MEPDTTAVPTTTLRGHGSIVRTPSPHRDPTPPPVTTRLYGGGDVGSLPRCQRMSRDAIPSDLRGCDHAGGARVEYGPAAEGANGGAAGSTGTAGSSGPKRIANRHVAPAPGLVTIHPGNLGREAPGGHGRNERGRRGRRGADRAPAGPCGRESRPWRGGRRVGHGFPPRIAASEAPPGACRSLGRLAAGKREPEPRRGRGPVLRPGPGPASTGLRRTGDQARQAPRAPRP